MFASLLIAAGIICGFFSLLAFLGVIAHTVAVTLLIAAVVCIVLGLVLRGRL